MYDTALVESARDLAFHVHAGQTDKIGEPYVGHCERVAGKLDDNEAKTVALLHDVLEDREDYDVSEADLRATYGERVARAVVLLTRTQGLDSATYYARIRANPLALQVKLADIHDNLEPRRRARLTPEAASHYLRKYGTALLALGAEDEEEL
jgi:(p)ppGpp synthase/HD superfamily hydrolase